MSAPEQPYAALRETHSAVVFLIGDLAVKVKKPVDLGFLDFTTREQRLAACRNEVELNRRLAPDVYLGVSDVLDPTGHVAEHLVTMRRMPEDRRLAELVRTGVDVRADLDHVARLVATFHESALRGPAISDAGTRDALAARWAANIAGIRECAGNVLALDRIDEIETLTNRFLSGRKALFDQRIECGAILDGHGDLLAEDIFCLDDGPRILDCLEFDARLRYVDRLDDLACLAMDLEHLGARAQADAFVAAYLDYSGENPPTGLIDHFIAYRAVVRAKVACIRAAQGSVTAAAEAREHAVIARRHLRAGTVRLVLVGGAPGTGKSTLAAALADECSLTLVSSDRVRKELAGVDPNSSMAAGYGAGIYTADHTAKTYEELLRRAGMLLEQGESVVLDATWADRTHRGAAQELAARTYSDLTAFECILQAPVAAARIRGRSGISDADPVVADAVRSTFAPWPEASGVDTSAAADVCLETALRALREDDD